VVSIDSKELQRYSTLRDALVEEAVNILRSFREPTKDIINNLINMVRKERKKERKREREREREEKERARKEWIFLISFSIFLFLHFLSFILFCRN
jgi:hypothetical protein